MFLLICKILKDGLAAPRYREDLVSYIVFFDLFDILTNRMQALVDKVNIFNLSLDV